MKKRFLAAVVCLVLSALMIPFSSFAAGNNVKDYPELYNIYAFGHNPKTDEPIYWLCSKVYNGKLKLVCLNGFDKLSDEIVNNFFSKEEKADIRTEHGAESLYFTDPGLLNALFRSGNKTYKTRIKNEDGKLEQLDFTMDGKHPIVLVARYSKLVKLIESRNGF